jgi:transcriptional regulator with XRE-family HTH domain
MKKSARKDGKGGWIPGKRRNPVEGWEQLRGELLELLATHHLRGVRLASACRVSSGTVSRWLAGEHVPSAASQRTIRRWIARHRKAIKQQERKR